MIPKECKRLAEVDFPIAEVSKHAAREKSIRHGHPSTLHLWWARRPLAACRAMLLALLLPDPADENCPKEFTTQARQLLQRLRGKIGDKPTDLRQALLKFIGEFANWDLSTNASYVEVSRELVKAAHGEEPPLVVDPFAGGGSIPLEALRLGCDVFASDLNPVACLILKVMLDDIPRNELGLADELRDVSAQIKKAAENELAEFYPADPDGARPIAYLWARTVNCESPHCGAEIPLVRSFWLSKKSHRKRALRYTVKRRKEAPPFVELEIFEPKTEADVPKQTVSRANATCPCCHTVLAAPRVRAQLTTQRGGADVIFDDKGKRIGGAMSLAVVTLKGTAVDEDTARRRFRLATDRDYKFARRAQEQLKKFAISPLANGLNRIPDETIPLMSGTFNAPIYGMRRWGDLFSARQKVAAETLRNIVEEVGHDRASAGEIAALALSRRADISNALCAWSVGATQVVHLFGRQAIPMMWDYAETSPFGGQAGDYHVTLATIMRVVESLRNLGKSGQVQLADAVDFPLPDTSASLWFTDPPYYFAVPYADLSDFFFVWLKRALPNHPLLRDPFDDNNPLTPKDRELCEMAHWDQKRYAHKDQSFFETGMRKAFAEGRRVLNENGIGAVVFAHKTTEGWEALLAGMIQGGWTLTASWPVATERPGRLRSHASAALATSVHLVCRPRGEDKIGDWSQVLRELPKRVGDWMERLQNEGIRGADLVFACIGPALEIFSRYSKVETAEGRAVDLAEYLTKVWEVVGRTALEQILGTAEAKARNGAAGALEEDARLTALFLWTMQSTSIDAEAVENDKEEESEDDDGEKQSNKKKKGPTLIFDVVRRFAQPLGIHLPDWEGRIIETEKGVVRLLPVHERSMQLFGEDGARGAASEIERGGDTQLVLFPDARESVTLRPRGPRRATRVAQAAQRDATTLDRIHAAMLLQSGGQANALRAMLEAEQGRSPDFLRLANALSALYPKESEEKRLLDAMLLGIRK